MCEGECLNFLRKEEKKKLIKKRNNLINMQKFGVQCFSVCRFYERAKRASNDSRDLLYYRYC